MDIQVLQSIIELTRQRDLDALEYSLVATVAELLPVRAVSLCRLSDARQDELEEVLRLDIKGVANGRPDFSWRQEAAPVPVDDDLRFCLDNLQSCTSRSPSDVLRLLLPVYFENKAMGVLMLDSGEDLSRYRDLLEGLVKIYSNHLVIINESERDKLTGLLNRRTFEKKLDRLLSVQHEQLAAQRQLAGENDRRGAAPSSQAWLAMLDIDHFKNINDTFGHVYGDEVILMLSQKMRQVFRDSDLLFRFGGEEFLVVLEPLPLENARVALERFRTTMASHVFSQVGQVTVSIGFAGIKKNDYPQTILENADKALYYAKEHGRNCCYNYETLLAEGRLSKARETGSVDLF